MLAVADADEADFIQIFVRTGCRDEEIKFTCTGRTLTSSASKS